MTATELSTFQRTLETIQTELGNGSREVLAVETSPDELDRIQHASNSDYAMCNLERGARQLREVQIALRRIKSSTFGICLDCDGNIDPKRLAAVPWASFCIVCQESADRCQEMAGRETDTPERIAA
jgi:DnaK suppressor protein